tara:strand:- start:3130 stop:7185 length:4056 start_codon:yes stop_codon:yes gene_type:complete
LVVFFIGVLAFRAGESRAKPSQPGGIVVSVPHRWVDLTKSLDKEARLRSVRQLFRVQRSVSETIKRVRGSLSLQKALIELVVDSKQTEKDKGYALHLLNKAGTYLKIPVSSLVSCLRSPRGNVRMNAASVLGRLGEDALSAIPALAKQLRVEKGVIIRKELLRAIRLIERYASIAFHPLVRGKQDTAATIRIFADVIKKDPDTQMKTLAVKALGELDAQWWDHVQPVFLRAFKHKEPDVRREVLRQMRRYFASHKLLVKEALRLAERDPKESVEREAIKTLGYYPQYAKQIIPLFRRLFMQGNDKVRQSILSASDVLGAKGREVMSFALRVYKERPDTERLRLLRWLHVFSPGTLPDAKDWRPYLTSQQLVLPLFTLWKKHKTHSQMLIPLLVSVIRHAYTQAGLIALSSWLSEVETTKYADVLLKDILSHTKGGDRLYLQPAVYKLLRRLVRDMKSQKALSLLKSFISKKYDLRSSVLFDLLGELQGSHDGAAKVLVEHLRRSWGRPHEKRLHNALVRLGKQTPAVVFTRLLKGLKDVPTKYRQRYLSSLAKVATDKKQYQVKLPHNAFSVLERKQLSGMCAQLVVMKKSLEDDLSGMACLRAIGELKRVKEELSTSLHERNRKSTLAFLRMLRLGKQEASWALPLVLWALKKNYNTRLRKQAVRTLGYLEAVNKAVLDAIHPISYSTYKKVLRRALRRMAGHPKGVEVLIARLRVETKVSMINNIIVGLRWHAKGNLAIQEVLKELLSHRSKSVRDYAVWALKYAGLDADLAMDIGLTLVQRDRASWVRQDAASLLGRQSPAFMTKRRERASLLARLFAKERDIKVKKRLYWSLHRLRNYVERADLRAYREVMHKAKDKQLLLNALRTLGRKGGYWKQTLPAMRRMQGRALVLDVEQKRRDTIARWSGKVDLWTLEQLAEQLRTKRTKKTFSKKLLKRIGHMRSDSLVANHAVMHVLRFGSRAQRLNALDAGYHLGFRLRRYAPVLFKMVQQEKDPHIRRFLAWRFAESSGTKHSYIKPLRALLRREKEPKVLVPLLWSLGKQGARAAEAVDDILYVLSTQRYWMTRYECVWALGRIGAKASKVYPVLLRLLTKNHKLPVRREAAHVLSKLKLTPKQVNKVGSKLVRVLSYEKHYDVRLRILSTLLTLKWKPMFFRIVMRGHLLTEPDRGLRWVIRYLLVFLGGKDVALHKLLCEQAVAAKRPENRWIAIWLLGMFKDKAHAQKSAKVLSDVLRKERLRYIRREAARVLGDLTSASKIATAALVKGLWDPAETVRMMVLRRLREHGKQALFALPLIKAFKRDHWYGVRRQADLTWKALSVLQPATKPASRPTTKPASRPTTKPASRPVK